MYLESSQFILCLTFVCGIMVLVMGLFFYTRNQQHLAYVQLQQASEKERIKHVEIERDRIARELHDNICMRLHLLGSDLATIEPDRMEHQALQGKLKVEVKSIIEELNCLAYEILPVGVAIKGPIYSFEQFIEERLGHTPMVIEVSSEDCTGLSEERSLHLYRMLQEILQNALKHSKAKNFLLNAMREGNRLTIETSDDGIGFDLENKKSRSGIGLYSLATRAELIGAELITNTAPGKGTRYIIRLTV